MLQPKLLKEVITLLNKYQITYMVSGSLASSIQGEPRSTHDVDIVINIAPATTSLLIDAFPPPQYYISETAVADAIRHKSMFNLLDTTEGDKIDFWILTADPFDQSRFTRRYQVNVLGLSMTVSKPEDTILMKLHWAELSGGSEKQFTDALRVYEVQYTNLDMNYIENWVSVLQVNNIWQRLKEEAKPI